MSSTRAESPQSALSVGAGVDAPPSLNPRFQRANKPKATVSELVLGLESGCRVCLGQAITRLESRRDEDQRDAEALLEACLPRSGASDRIGITGIPGVGKSTLIQALGLHILEPGKRKLAILTVDPSSITTQGSILGDKSRMSELANHPRAFVRPSPNAGSLGGVAATTRETIVLCEAAGFDTVFVETVGVGQSEVAVRDMVDVFVLLALAGAGDELQGIKRGVMEMADMIAITKCDGDNLPRAEIARQHLESALHYLTPTVPGWQTPVTLSSAVEPGGVRATWTEIERFLKFVRDSGWREHRRSEQDWQWTLTLWEREVLRRLTGHPRFRSVQAELETQVRAGRITPRTAVKAMLEALS